MTSITDLPLQIEVDIIARILGIQPVLDLIGKNEQFASLADQYAIRSGGLLTGDPYPGIVVNIRNIQHQKDLAEFGNLQTAQLEVSCISFAKPEAWALRNAVAYAGEDPDDPTRSVGLDTFKDHSKQIFGCGLCSDELDELAIATDGTDRTLWFVESTYSIEFRERKL